MRLIETFQNFSQYNNFIPHIVYCSQRLKVRLFGDVDIKL